jgi:ABC-2 type transport system permease protein
MYSREKESVFFSFLFPILLLALFSTIFGPVQEGRGTGGGMTRAGSSCPACSRRACCSPASRRWPCQSPASATTARSSGCAHPHAPGGAYFLGKVGLVAITSSRSWCCSWSWRGCLRRRTAQLRRRWLTLAWIFALGVFGGTTLGIAYSSLGTARSIGAVVIGPLLVLQFISGVYIAFSDIPTWLQQVAAIFPLKWIAQGMRSVFLPDSFAASEMAGAWEPGRTALVLAVWAVVGLVLCVRTFRWFKRGTT